MSAPPVPPPNSERNPDSTATWYLLLGLFVLTLVLGAYSAFGSRDCVGFPGECDKTLVAISAALAPPGLWVIFGISMITSIVLLNRGKRASFVPLFGAGAMVICLIIASYLRP